MRRAVLFLLPACAPKWIDEGYQPEAARAAIQVAAKDHACPVSDVKFRCDASSTEKGRDTVAYEPDGVVGTMPDKLVRWVLELDVCGDIRRYRMDDGGVFAEQEMACGLGVCTPSESGCKAMQKGAWTAIRTDPPEGCDRADVDPEISLAVERGFVTLAIENRSQRAVARHIAGDCKHPSLMIAVDKTWFAACGPVPDVDSIASRESIVIKSGLQLSGAHEVMAVAIDPEATDVWSTCRRSRAIELEAPNARPPTWVDL